VHLADELSAELARQKGTIPVANRELLGKHLSVLREERVPAGLQRSAPVMRWLGKQLNATVVMDGMIEGQTSSTVQLSAHLLSVEDPKLKSPTAGGLLTLLPSMSSEELSVSDPLPPLPSRPETTNGEPIYQAGRPGVGLPSCQYMPNPPYTDEARKFQLSGSIVLEAIIDTQGTIRNPRIVRGLPFGLNEFTTRIMSIWKCKPATLEGQPVSTYVPFEVTFRLY
jgi:TonB family protein